MDFGYNYNYQYDFPSSYNGHMGDSVFAAVMSIYLIVLTVVIIFGLTSYIFHSIAIYTIGKRMGREHSWLAFIPFARDYFHGELAEEIRLKNKSIKNPGIWKLVLPIGFSVVTGIFVFTIFMVGIIGTIGGGFGFGIMFMILLYMLFILLIIAYSAAHMVLNVMINIQIYERFTTHNMAIVHSVLAATVPLYEALSLFVMRNRDFMPGMEPKMTPPPVQPVPPVSPMQMGGPVPPQPPVRPEAPSAPQPPVHPEAPSVPQPPVYPEMPLNSEKLDDSEESKETEIHL